MAEGKANATEELREIRRVNDIAIVDSVAKKKKVSFKKDCMSMSGLN